MNLHDDEQKKYAEQSRDREGAESNTEPTPYDPSTDGFVFQVADIKAHSRRQERLARAYDLLENADDDENDDHHTV